MTFQPEIATDSIPTTINSDSEFDQLLPSRMTASQMLEMAPALSCSTSGTEETKFVQAEPEPLTFTHRELMTVLTHAGYNVRGQDPLIAKTTPSVGVHSITEDQHPLHLKGLIFRKELSTGLAEILAPGCPVPLESERVTELPVKLTEAMDGVQFRVYYMPEAEGPGYFNASTTGMIHPNGKWGPRGMAREFISMFSDLDDQWNPDLLNKDHCYYVMMTHVDQTNIVKHTESRLTLTSIVNRVTLAPVPIESDTGFVNHVAELPLEQASYLTEVLVQDQGGPRPLTNADMFYKHYADGSMFRVESELFKQASAIKPNYPDPRQHWIHLLSKAVSPGVTHGDVLAQMTQDHQVYLSFFPWHKELFSKMEEHFMEQCQMLLDIYDDLQEQGPGLYINPRFNPYMRQLYQEYPRSEEFTLTNFYNHLLAQPFKRLMHLGA